MFWGVNTFEHEPEGKEDRMMEILFMKKELKVFANAVIQEDNTRKPHNDILRWRKAQKWSGNCNEEQCSKINDGILGNFR